MPQNVQGELFRILKDPFCCKTEKNKLKGGFCAIETYSKISIGTKMAP